MPLRQPLSRRLRSSRACTPAKQGEQCCQHRGTYSRLDRLHRLQRKAADPDCFPRPRTEGDHAHLIVRWVVGWFGMEAQNAVST